MSQVGLRTRVGQALLLFTESGLLYCILWVSTQFRFD